MAWCGGWYGVVDGVVWFFGLWGIGFETLRG